MLSATFGGKNTSNGPLARIMHPGWRLAQAVLVVGFIVAVVAFAFIFSGGEFGGKKTIEGDRDLPPVETTNN